MIHKCVLCGETIDPTTGDVCLHLKDNDYICGMHFNNPSRIKIDERFIEYECNLC